MTRQVLFAGAIALAMSTSAEESKSPTVKLMTLDPGHFHAALVQKFMYPQVDPAVHVYAPAGDDVMMHQKRIDGFNTRTNLPPTKWQQKLYTGDDFAEKMFAEKPGNVVVLSGNNAKKSEYILRCVQGGLNVLADKPMAITPEDLKLLREAFETARKNKVLLYDIMTERSEITTALQRELSRDKDLFGQLDKGSPTNPAVVKQSVHYYSKEVAGSPLRRPPWFFDVRQQGEGIVDVTTHLVDLVQWEAFPDETLAEEDVKMVSARRWPTQIAPAQFKKVTNLDTFPDYLKTDTDKQGNLQVYCNGEFVYTLRGIHSKVSVVWDFEAPPGSKDTHYSIMRGTKADLIIRQGLEEKFKPTLYVENISQQRQPEELQDQLKAAINRLQDRWPGVSFHRDGKYWIVDIPAKYDVGHEAHFGEVTERYLQYLAAGKLPVWEEPNMIVKYATIMQALELARRSK